MNKQWELLFCVCQMYKGNKTQCAQSLNSIIKTKLCVKFTQVYFPRFKTRREQIWNWIHADKKLIYGIISAWFWFQIIRVYILLQGAIQHRDNRSIFFQRAQMWFSDIRLIVKEWTHRLDHHKTANMNFSLWY